MKKPLQVINIRGTSGSGKSTLVRELMEAWGDRTPVHDAKSILGYRVVRPKYPDIYFPGRYETACGGCDTIKTMDEVERRVRHWSLLGHVVFEGLMISAGVGRWSVLADKLRRDRVTFAYLDTPLGVCLTRIEERRRARGVTEPLDPYNTTQKFRGVESSKKTLIARGYQVKTLDHMNPLPQIIALLTREI